MLWRSSTPALVLCLSLCLSLSKLNFSLFCVPLCPFMPLNAPSCPFMPLNAPSCPFIPFIPLYVPLHFFMPLYAPLCPFTPLYTPLYLFTSFYMLLHALQAEQLPRPRRRACLSVGQSETCNNDNCAGTGNIHSVASRNKLEIIL